MTGTFTVISKRRLALIAGYALLLMAAIAGYAYGYAFQHIYVPMDADATFLNLRANPLLFRSIILCFIIILLLDIVVAWALYLYFRNVDKRLSLLAAWIRLIYAPMLGASLLSLLAIIPDGAYPVQDTVVVMRHIQQFLSTWSFGLLIFAFHLLVLGYILMNYVQLPRVVALLTLLAGLCYLGTNTANLLFNDYKQYQSLVESILTIPMALGELVLAFWLIEKGGKYA